MEKIILHNEDCIEQMQKMIDEGVQVDSVVTDPPYELGFMGKSWDSTGIAFQKETWKLAFQLLKPGGHLLAFTGSRTYHRIAVAVEDAGFEIRDQIMWLYGSGFPKSLNIGKSIDKQGGKIGKSVVELKTKLIALVDKCGKTRNQIDKECGFRATNYLTLPKEGKKFDAWVGILPTDEKWLKMKEVINSDDDMDKIFVSAKREVIGKKKVIKGVAFSSEGKTEMDITEPATKEAKQWEGWGTALKPAHEPVVMARKPVEGTVAENVLKHGTGGINIDGCRIGKEILEEQIAGQAKIGTFERKNMVTPKREGRYPANVMHDGLEQEWARYFYCPKVSKNERNRGLDDFEEKKTSSMSGRRDPHDMGNSKIDNDVTGRFVTKRKNIHPTVKPIELMKYLCRLVTPKGGTVLDPFMGSGSTGMAAKDEGFGFIGIEKEKEYFEIAKQRIVTTSPLLDFL
jgi:DNA modification methylase